MTFWMVAVALAAAVLLVSAELGCRRWPRRVHVGNIGHSGVGAADLDLIFERVLPQYRRLDVIVVMVGASTVYHWLEDGAPPSSPPSVVPESLLFACHPGQSFTWTPPGW